MCTMCIGSSSGTACSECGGNRCSISFIFSAACFLRCFAVTRLLASRGYNMELGLTRVHGCLPRTSFLPSFRVRFDTLGWTEHVRLGRRRSTRCARELLSQFDSERSRVRSAPPLKASDSNGPTATNPQHGVRSRLVENHLNRNRQNFHLFAKKGVTKSDFYLDQFSLPPTTDPEKLPLNATFSTGPFVQTVQ